jgi:hypothetical protein
MDTDTPIAPAVAATNGSSAAAAPAELDLDAWIDGTCGITHTARIYQRGDLLATLDKLEQELEVAKKRPPEQRGVADRTPEMIRTEWEQVATELADSAMVVHIQDRTSARRRNIAKRFEKQGLDEKRPDDYETIMLHQLADSIVRVELADGSAKDLPEGFPPAKLRQLKDRLGDAGLFDALDTYRKVTQEAPTVAAPLSLGSSSGRGGGM